MQQDVHNGTTGFVRRRVESVRGQPHLHHHCHQRPHIIIAIVLIILFLVIIVHIIIIPIIFILIAPCIVRLLLCATLLSWSTNGNRISFIISFLEHLQIIIITIPILLLLLYDFCPVSPRFLQFRILINEK